MTRSDHPEELHTGHHHHVDEESAAGHAHVPEPVSIADEFAADEPRLVAGVFIQQAAIPNSLWDDIPAMHDFTRQEIEAAKRNCVKNGGFILEGEITLTILDAPEYTTEIDGDLVTVPAMKALRIEFPCASPVQEG